MGVLFPNTERQNVVYQPQLTRWRFAYRSPMNSLRLNQETSQIHYDIAKLYEKISDLSELLEEDFEILFGDTIALDDADFTISWGNVEVQSSLKQLALQLDKLNQRIEILERNRNG